MSEAPRVNSEIGLTPQEMQHWLKDATRGIIPTGGKCIHGCIYCILKSNFNGIHLQSAINFISREDLIYALDLLKQINKEVKVPITDLDIGAGGRIIQSEPFFHPYYVDLLKIAHEYFPDIQLSTTTLGRWIQEKDYNTFRDLNWGAHVSLHTLDQDKRNIMMKGKDDLEGLIRFIKNDDLINEFFMVFHGDLDVFKKDLDRLEKINPKLIKKRFSIWPIAYTDTTKTNKTVVEMSELGKKHFAEMLRYGIDNGIDINPTFWELEDSMKMVPKGASYEELEHQKKDFDRRIVSIIYKIESMRIHLDDVGFMLSDSVWNYSKKFDKFINRINIKNHTFGGNVIVSGLLTRDDFYRAIKEHKKKYKYYVIPSNVFRVYDEDVALNKFSSYNTDEFKFILG